MIVETQKNYSLDLNNWKPNSNDGLLGKIKESNPSKEVEDWINKKIEEGVEKRLFEISVEKEISNLDALSIPPPVSQKIEITGDYKWIWDESDIEKAFQVLLPSKPNKLLVEPWGENIYPIVPTSWGNIKQLGFSSHHAYLQPIESINLVSPFIAHSHYESYLQPIDAGIDKSYVDPNLESEFMSLAEKCEEKMRFKSILKDIINNSYYRQIVGMGDSIIPVLLREMENNPILWTSALSDIARKRNPIKDEHRGDLRKIISTWKEWGKENKFIR